MSAFHVDCVMVSTDSENSWHLKLIFRPVESWKKGPGPGNPGKVLESRM